MECDKQDCVEHGVAIPEDCKKYCDIYKSTQIRKGDLIRVVAGPLCGKEGEVLIRDRTEACISGSGHRNPPGIVLLKHCVKR